MISLFESNFDVSNNFNTFKHAIDAVLGDVKQDQSTHTSYNHLSSFSNFSKLFDLIIKEADALPPVDSDTMMTSLFGNGIDNRVKNSRQYLFLAALIIPCIAKFIDACAKKFDMRLASIGDSSASGPVEPLIYKYIISTADASRSELVKAAHAMSEAVYETLEIHTPTAPGMEVADDYGATQNSWATHMNGVTKIIKTAEFFITKLVNAAEKAGFTGCSESDYDAAVWVAAGNMLRAYVNASVSSQSSDSSELLYRGIERMSKSEPGSETIVVKDPSKGNDTQLGLITAKTKCTAGEVFKMFAANKGELIASDLHKDNKKSDSSANIESKDMLYFLGYILHELNILPSYKTTMLATDLGASIDAIFETLASDTIQANNVRLAIIDFIDSIDDYDDFLNIFPRPAGHNIQANSYVPHILNRIKKEFLYDMNGSVSGKLGEADITISNVSGNPCLGSEDTTNRTIDANRTGLTNNGETFSSLIANNGEAFVITKGFEQSASGQLVSNTPIAEVNYDDANREYIAPALVKTGVSGEKTKSWYLIHGLVPYTTLSGNTLADVQGMSGLSEHLGHEIAAAERPSSSEINLLQQRKTERLGNVNFQNDLKRLHMASEKYTDSDYEQMAAIAGMTYPVGPDTGDSRKDRFEYDSMARLSVIDNYCKRINNTCQSLRDALREFGILKTSSIVRDGIDANIPNVNLMFNDKIPDDRIRECIANMKMAIAGRLFRQDKIVDNTPKILKGVSRADSLLKLLNSVETSEIDEKTAGHVVAAANAVVVAERLMPMQMLVQSVMRDNDSADAGRVEQSIKNVFSRISTLAGYRLDGTLGKHINDVKELLPDIKQYLVYSLINPDGTKTELARNQVDTANSTLDATLVNIASNLSERAERIISAVIDETGNVSNTLVNIHHEILSSGLTMADISQIIMTANTMASVDVEDGKPMRSVFSAVDCTCSTLRAVIEKIRQMSRIYNAASLEDVNDAIDPTEYADNFDVNPDPVRELNYTDNTKSYNANEFKTALAQTKQELDEHTGVATKYATQIVSLCDDIYSAKRDKIEYGHIIKGYETAYEEAVEDNDNGTASEIKREIETYKTGWAEREALYNESVDKLNALVMNTTDVDLHLIGDVVASSRVSGESLKRACAAIDTASMIIKKLNRNGKVLPFTMSDDTAVAQIILVIGTFIFSKYNMYADTVRDLVSSLKSIRRIIEKNSGNPVSISAADYAIEKLESATTDETYSDDTYGWASSAVSVLSYLGGVLTPDSKETLSRFVNNVNGIQKHGDFNDSEDNAIDAFARARFRGVKKYSNAPTGAVANAHESYYDNMVTEMESNPELADFAYSVGLMIGTFDRSITDERYNANTRLDRSEASIYKNMARNDILYGNMADNDLQREAINALIDDERNGDSDYNQLMTFLTTVMNGQPVYPYVKNYSKTDGSDATKGGSKERVKNGRVFEIQQNDDGQQTIAMADAASAGEQMSLNTIMGFLGGDKLSHEVNEPADITKDDIIAVVKSLRRVVGQKVLSAVYSTSDVTENSRETTETREVVNDSIKRLVADLDTPISYIVAAGTHAGQKAAAHVMIDKNRARMIQYASDHGKNDQNFHSDMERMLVQMNKITPTRTADRANAIDLEWAYSVCSVLASIPDAVSLDMADHFASLYFGSSDNSDELLSTKIGQQMYAIFESLTELDTESGLPHGFFGDTKSDQYKTIVALLRELYSNGDSDSTMGQRAQLLYTKFTESFSNGGNSVAIGSIKPSEATVKRIGHMRLGPTAFNAMTDAGFENVMRELASVGYIRNSVGSSDFVVTMFNESYDERTFRNFVSEALKLAESAGDLNEHANITTVIPYLNMVIVAYDTGIDINKQIAVMSERPDVDDSKIKKLIAALMDNGKIQAYPKCQMVSIDPFGVIYGNLMVGIIAHVIAAVPSDDVAVLSDAVDQYITELASKGEVKFDELKFKNDHYDVNADDGDEDDDEEEVPTPVKTTTPTNAKKAKSSGRANKVRNPVVRPVSTNDPESAPESDDSDESSVTVVDDSGEEYQIEVHAAGSEPRNSVVDTEDIDDVSTVVGKQPAKRQKSMKSSQPKQTEPKPKKINKTEKEPVYNSEYDD
ncbi:MAG: hypothetical protein MJZ25_03920 [Fibrobacter sp.]|nr:hypothetical protein [Fibrobacter sp.]